MSEEFPIFKQLLSKGVYTPSGEGVDKPVDKYGKGGVLASMYAEVRSQDTAITEEDTDGDTAGSVQAFREDEMPAAVLSGTEAAAARKLGLSPSEYLRRLSGETIENPMATSDDWRMKKKFENEWKWQQEQKNEQELGRVRDAALSEQQRQVKLREDAENRRQERLARAEADRKQDSGEDTTVLKPGAEDSPLP